MKQFTSCCRRAFFDLLEGVNSKTCAVGKPQKPGAWSGLKVGGINENFRPRPLLSEDLLLPLFLHLFSH